MVAVPRIHLYINNQASDGNNSPILQTLKNPVCGAAHFIMQAGITHGEWVEKRKRNASGGLG
jgi:hypothetical protein